MVEIGKTLVSFDVFREFFLCDLEMCRGACCIEGDSGAPLEEEEAKFIETDFDTFSGFLPEEHRLAVQQQGFTLTDKDGDLVTPLVNNRQCAYSFFDEEGILKCSIEKAWQLGRTNFRKPVSCHLFPIRIHHYRYYDAVNYESIDICRAGRECGMKSRIPLYRFLKEPLIRKYGETWYTELESIAGDKNFMQKIKLE
jgi:hypothetical protein